MEGYRTQPGGHMKQMVLIATPGFLFRSLHYPMLHFAVLQIHSAVAEQLELTSLF